MESINSVPTLRRIKTVHFVGIGGSGMCGIAEVLFNLGYQVTGSDLHKNSSTERLSSLGIPIAYSHIAENAAECDAIVVSTAIPSNNIELETARVRRIPIVPRAEMLAELMRFKQGIAVAGTHGKTTTTSLIATLFAAAKLDPTFVVGGQINSYGFNAKLGQGGYFIAEADESDASFLHLSPMISVVTNIDRDHMGTYGDDFTLLSNTFLEFIHRLPFYGLAVLCIDDPVIRTMLPHITRPYITYGFAADADVKALSWQPEGQYTNFTMQVPGLADPIAIKLNLAGKHNVLNALAAVAVSLDANIPMECIKDGLAHFKGVGRRFQTLGQYQVAGKNITLVDDYGHHPREVKAVIDAMRGSWQGRRLVMIYQPHRYSRTKDLFEDFAATLSEVDVLVMLEIYSAGEAAIAGVDSRTLCGSIRKRGVVDPIFVEDPEQLFAALQGIIQDGDIIITQGAGTIGKIARQLAENFEEFVA